MKKYILIASVFASIFNASAQVDRSIIPTPGKAPIINIKESQVFTLPNGVTVILSENHNLPKVSFNMVMGGDAQLEGNKAGLSGLAGQLINSGTTTRSKDVLDGEIDFIGATLSASSENVYLSCLTKHMSKGLTLMADVLLNPIFPEDELDRLKKQAESGLLSAKSEPAEMSKNALVKSIYTASHPRGEVMTETSLASITRGDIQKYYTEYFTPKGAYLVIVGDITKAEAEKAANDYFGNWKGGSKITSNTGNAEALKGNRVIFVNQPGAVQSNISIAFPLEIKTGSPDEIALDVLTEIFGGKGFSTRLMKNVREDKGFTYGAYASNSITTYGSHLATGGAFRNEVTDSAIVEMLKEIESLSNDFVSDEELKATLASMAGDFGLSLERPQTIAGFALNIIRYNLPKDYYQTYLKKLSMITKDDLLDIAQKYYNVKRCNIIVVGSKDILPKLTRFDSDGKVELKNEFGDEAKETLPSDLTKEEFLNKYVDVMIAGKNAKAKAKTLKKFKSYESDEEATIQGQKLLAKSVYIAPGKTYEAMSVQGMTVQSSTFNGVKGQTSNMQTGAKEMTAEELTEAKKSASLVPEMNYSTNGTNYEMVGIEEVSGKMNYVIKIKTEKATSFNYYDKSTFFKTKSVSISTDEEGKPSTAVATYEDYKLYNGIYFPQARSISVGDFSLKFKTTSFVVNVKPSEEVLKAMKL